MQTIPRPKGPISSSAPPPFRPKKKMPGEVNPEPLNKNRLTGAPAQQGPGQGSMFANGRKGQPQGNPPRSPSMGNSMQGPAGVRGQSQGAPPRTPNYPQPGSRMPSGQRQGNPPPTPNYPMANGGKAPMRPGMMRRPMMPPQMMADGGFGTPPPIGAGEPDADDMQMDQGAQDDQGAGPSGGGDAGPMPVIRPEAVNYHDSLHQCSGCQYFSQDGNCAVLSMTVSPTGGCTAYEDAAGRDQGPTDGAQPGDDLSGGDQQGSDGY